MRAVHSDIISPSHYDYIRSNSYATISTTDEGLQTPIAPGTAMLFHKNHETVQVTTVRNHRGDVVDIRLEAAVTHNAFDKRLMGFSPSYIDLACLYRSHARPSITVIGVCRIYARADPELHGLQEGVCQPRCTIEVADMNPTLGVW